MFPVAGRERTEKLPGMERTKRRPRILAFRFGPLFCTLSRLIRSLEMSIISIFQGGSVNADRWIAHIWKQSRPQSGDTARATFLRVVTQRCKRKYIGCTSGSAIAESRLEQRWTNWRPLPATSDMWGDCVRCAEGLAARLRVDPGTPFRWNLRSFGLNLRMNFAELDVVPKFDVIELECNCSSNLD